MSYTEAHSPSFPPGSVAEGWYYKTMVSNCRPSVTVVDWLEPLPADHTRTGGLLLCPVAAPHGNRTGAPAYKLYANTRAFNQTGCIGAVGILERGNAAEFGAWEYT